MICGWRNAGMWLPRRGDNLLDGAAPFYRCYATRDNRFLAAGAIEQRFYAAFRRVLGLAEPLFDEQMDRARWPEMCERIAAIVASRTLPEWQGAIDDPDACLSPVLSLDEAAHHPHIAARQTLRFEGDAVIAGAAPCFLPGPGGAPPPGAEHQRGDRRLAGERRPARTFGRGRGKPTLTRLMLVLHYRDTTSAIITSIQ